MSENMLSQDEIDALLKGTADLDIDEILETPPVSEFLSPIEQDALGEIGNISFGSSATALSTLLNQKVDITTPSVTIVQHNSLANEFPHPCVAVEVKYTEGLSGANLLVIKQSDAAIIADLMLGGDGTNPPDMLDEIQISAVQEAMNQMMGSAATSMSTMFSKKVDISPPSINLFHFKNGVGIQSLPEDEMFVRVSFNLKIGQLIDSNIMQLLPIEFSKEIVANLLNPTIESAELEKESINSMQNDPKDIADSIKQSSHSRVIDEPMHQVEEPYYSNQDMMSQFAQPNLNMNQPQHVGFGRKEMNQANVQPVDFANFEPVQLAQAEMNNLNMLLDIPLQVTVELGRTKRSVKEILALTTGSIIELDKLAGEPVDILVNNKLIAKGEVVVIDENFGVRVTDILSQSDRIKKLR